jgi:hypothetical protein
MPKPTNTCENANTYQNLKRVRQMQVVGWLPADQSNFFDDNGDAAALWWASGCPLASFLRQAAWVSV